MLVCKKVGEIMIYVFFGLLALAAILLMLLILLLYHPEKKPKTIYGSGGIDPNTGQETGEEIHGYRGLNYGTIYVSAKDRLRAIVFLEDCLTKDQFRAELGRESVIGRLVPGSQNLNHIAVSTSTNISRRHCRLFMHNNCVYIENISQTTYTLLNGRTVDSPQIINTGDIIGLGDAQLRVLSVQVYIYV